LELDEDSKEIIQKLGDAINQAVERSSEVAESIERLRQAGYELELTLRLEIGLRPHNPDSDEMDESDASLFLTDEDKQTLRRMKIRIDEVDES
jgi:site-specific recombinase